MAVTKKYSTYNTIVYHTAEEWKNQYKDTILAKGELGVSYDADSTEGHYVLKVGNGTSTWTSLEPIIANASNIPTFEYSTIDKTLTITV